LRLAVQVYVGDFIKVDVGDDNTKGWSVAQIEELYQTGDVSRLCMSLALLVAWQLLLVFWATALCLCLCLLSCCWLPHLQFE
jgi:hypothetical protein